jgi:hypothetical protein
MSGMESEKDFANYLEDQGFLYERDYYISPGDFDFCVETQKYHGQELIDLGNIMFWNVD